LGGKFYCVAVTVRSANLFYRKSKGLAAGFTPSNTPSIALRRIEGVASADCPVSLGLFEPPDGQSQVLLHSGLPHHSPHHATLIGMMGYEVRIGLQTLAFPTLAGQNPKSYFTPDRGIKGDRLGDRS